MNASPSSSVIVVGGGLAGLSAALRLAERGIAVTLVETRQRLGGRATSFVDPTTGEVLDNCQHVLMRCCTHLIDLYQRLDVERHIQWHSVFHFAGQNGAIDDLEADGLPAPLHLTWSMLRFTNLTWREKLAIARGMWALIRAGTRERRKWHDLSFNAWLEINHQPRSAIDKFWEAIIVSACNETVDRVSTTFAMQVFQEGFLNNDQAYEMGLATVPLLQLYDSAKDRIEQAGGSVMLSTSVEQFTHEHGRITGLKLKNGETRHADVYISAVPFDRLHKLCDEQLRRYDQRLTQLMQLDVSPIIGVHLFLGCPDGRPIMTLPHIALMESPLQWIFNKGCEFRSFELATSSSNGESRTVKTDARHIQHLHGVISAAHQLVDQPAELIMAMALDEIERILPAAKDAELIHARAIKEKRATFSVRPGVNRLRPTTTGNVENLLLAGDWTDTGWPATMEGAVRSGYRAAAAACRQLAHNDHDMIIPELQPTTLYRWLARA